MHKLALLFSFLFILAISTVKCQEFPMLHYTVEDGLPSNIIYQVYKDSKGFLWIATDKGIARYNGIRFETFNIFDGLPDNEIFFFKEDFYGRLWLGTSNGKLCYYANDTFYTEKNTPFLKLHFNKPHFDNVALETDSSITMTNYEPGTFINITKNHVFEFNFRGSVPTNLGNGYYYIKKISNSTYRLFGKHWYCIIDTLHNIKALVKNDSVTHSLYLRRPISDDSDYFLDYNYIYISKMQILKTIKINNFINNLYIKGNYLFLGTSNGLVINDSLRILQNKEISSITTDAIGNFWIGTKDGLFYFKNNFLSTKIIRSAYSGSIKYCNVTERGVYYVDINNNLYNLRNDKPICLFSYKGNKNNESINAACLIDKNNYYSIYDKSNIHINLDDLSVKKYPQYFGIDIRTLINTKHHILLKTNTHIFKLQYKYKKIDYLPLTASQSYERIYGFAKDNNDIVWYSTIKNMFSIVNDKIFLQSNFGDITLKAFDFLGENMVGYSFNNQLFVISNLYGKLSIDSSFQSQHCIWDKLYKINDSIMLITTDNRNRLLTVNKSGKVTISVIENAFVPLNFDALCADSVNCYFFKDGAISVMKIQSLFGKSPPPTLLPSFIRTIRNKYRIDRKLKIPYNESRNLTIVFSTISFGGKEVSYQYSVTKNGHDNWIPLKSEEINFVNPGYGNYVIEVRGKTSFSDYSQPVIFTFQILKPFWATWWFISLSVCAFLSLTAIVVWLRIRYIVRKKERLHDSEVKLMKLEYKALNALMNPHFIFNSLNNMQALVNKNEKLAANKYLSIFANLIRRNMHNISLELIPLSEELEIVADYLKLEKLRFKDLLSYEINVADEVDTSEIMVPPLLVQPLVENSIKHGLFPRKSPDSCVKVEIYEQDNRLVIAVKDNGIGMAEARKKVEDSHKSYGLDNIRKRLEQLSIIQNRQITLDIREEKDSSDILWTVVSIAISLQ